MSQRGRKRKDRRKKKANHGKRPNYLKWGARCCDKRRGPGFRALYFFVRRRR